MSVPPTPTNTPLVSAKAPRGNRSAAALAVGLQKDTDEEQLLDFSLPPPKLTRQHNVGGRHLLDLRQYLDQLNL